MSETRWIDEQKRNRMFRGSADSNDPAKMLEWGGINKISNRDQAMKVVTARLIGQAMGVSCLGELADMVEKSQSIQDGQARADFMKVAIEQWQGKLLALKSKIVETMIQ